MDIKDKVITVIGAQRSGQALCRLIHNRGGQARVSDYHGLESIDNQFRDWADGHNILIECDGHTQDFFRESDCIVLSPGVRGDIDILQWARGQGMPVLGEIEFAFQFCDKPVIAVTGSNGKTTTVNLIHQVIEESRRKSCLCGNVGTPFSLHVMNDSDWDMYVIEVSSFQLESLLDTEQTKRVQEKCSSDFKVFRPTIAVILNISENHLDRHADMDEYIIAKFNIFKNQQADDAAILSSKDGFSENLINSLSSQVFYYDRMFSQVTTNPNYQAVLAVSQRLGLSDDICKKVFSQFKGVEHRMEFVRSIDGVDFINDSKATTAEAGRWALNLLDKPVILICGGRDKNVDFTRIRKVVEEKVKLMIVIGEAQKKISQSLEGATEIVSADSLKEAVSKALDRASIGDCVVLSPMCASFDMFKDYEQRGHAFKEIVNHILV